MFLPRSILPLLVACAVATLIVYMLHGYLCPPEDDGGEDRRRALRQCVFNFMTAVLACLGWHVIGPFSDKWHYLFDGGGNAAVYGGSAAADAFFTQLPSGVSVPVDSAMPAW